MASRPAMKDSLVLLLVFLVLCLFAGAGSSQVLDHTQLATRINLLTDDHLLKGFSLMKDYLPADFNPQTIVGHVKAGTAPTLTAAQLQKLQGSQGQGIVLHQAPQPSLDTCISDTISICWDSFGLLVSFFGISSRVAQVPNSLSMLPQEARSFEGLVAIMANSAASLRDRATSLLSLISGVVHIWGLPLFVHAYTQHLSGWDYVKTVLAFAAQSAIWIGSDGVGFVAEVSLMMAASVDLALDLQKFVADQCLHVLDSSSPPPALRLALAENADGRLEIFTIDQGSVALHRYQFHDGRWSDWQGLASGIPMARLAVAINTNGWLEAFALGRDHATYHTRQDSARPSGWGEWASFGGWSSEIAVGTNADGRLEVFAVGSNNRAYHIYQLSPSSSSWSGWHTLGGENPMKELTVSVQRDGRLQVFGLDPNQALSYIHQGPNGAGGWESWQALGGWSSSIATSINDDGRLEVFAVASSTNAFHIWQNIPNADSWSGWTNLHSLKVQQLTATRLANGKIIVFGVGPDRAVYYSALAPSWTEWRSLGGSVSTISAITTRSQIVKVFAVFSGDKNVYVLNQLRASDPHSWSNWIPLN